MIISAGALIKAQDTGRCLFIQRSSETTYPTCWALVGGKMHHKENVLEGLSREINEELGLIPTITKWIVFNRYDSEDKNFCYHSLLILTPNEFIPKLNHENDGYAWVDINNPPNPLHPRLKEVIKTKVLKESIKNFL